MAKKETKDQQDQSASKPDEEKKPVKADESSDGDKNEDTEVQPLTDEEKKVDPDSPYFYLKVYSPYKLYYEGQVESITAENLTGPFDILKGHKNFLTLLIPCELQVRAQHGDEQIKINRGIMHVKADQVLVFLDV